MKVPGWLRWIGKNVVFPIIKTEVELITQKELQRHGVGVPVSPDSPGLVLHEEPKRQ